MRTARRAGRLVGGLIVAQMVGGVLVNFVLAAPLFGSPGFLVSAATHASQIVWSVLLGLALGALTVGIAVTICLLVRNHAPALALLLLALATASLAAVVAEQISVMSMLSLSEAYANAPAADQGSFEGLRMVVASARNWSHYIGLAIAGSTIFVMYATLYRTVFVPRAIAVSAWAQPSFRSQLS